MKKQVMVIHGGHIFNSRKDYLKFLFDYKIDFKKIIGIGWKESLGEKLGKGYEVVLPKMPCPSNAKYPEWKIWFEKLFPFLEKEVVLVGHSLGGVFLVKYLSENRFPKKILAAFIVAAPFDDNDPKHALATFKPKKDLSGLQGQCEKLFFYHSEDDDVVSYASFKKYQKILPKAIFREFKNKGHFSQSNFPEIARDIQRIF